MGWWKADPAPEPQPSSHPSPPASIPHPPVSASTSTSDASACPVDEKTRNIWLQSAKSKQRQQEQEQQQARNLSPSHPPLPPPHSSPPKTQASSGSSTECSSDRITQSAPLPSASDPSSRAPRPLSHAREISSIPRAPQTAPTPHPSNSEAETGTSASGNWIYPSESQFYNAVMRKQTAASPDDLISSISHIIPIHNAVNERAWSMIRSWETPYTTPTCQPKLLSFQGLGSGALSPRARFKTWMGYTAPFDRHDWVVQRCGGETVEYVIDFYQGKSDGATAGKLNFYLDVRPKLNSVEGCKMRALKFWGLSSG